MKWARGKKIGRAAQEEWWRTGGATRFLLRLLRESLARIGAVVLVAVAAVVYAQTYDWDPAQNTGAATDGSGTWNAGTTPNWYNGTAVPWTNDGSITASIGAANAGTASAPNLITIATSTTINVAGITFNNVTPYVSNSTGENTGYTIAPTDPTSILNLEGTGQIVDNTAATTVSIISAAIGGTAGLSLSGTGTLALTGTNTYTGGTTIASGSTLQIGNGTSAGSIGGNVTDNGVLAFDNTGLVTNTTTTTNGSTIVTTNNVISGTGSVLVEAGTVDLPGADTYSGGTTLQAGSILVQNATGLGSSSGALVVNAGTLDLGGYSVSVGSLNGTGGKITDNGAAATLSLGAGGTYAGALQNGSGNLGLTLGSGTLILTGANTYSGTTTISAGTLQIGNGGTTGSLNTSGGISDGGALVFDSNAGGVTSTLGGVISGGGTLTQEGAGTIVLTNTNTYTGATTISAGTLQLGNGGTTGTIVLTNNITDNGALVFDTLGGTKTVGGVISGNGSVTEEGAGSTVIFNNTQTYTGATTIVAGTLQIGNGGSAGGINASGNILDNGALVFDTTNATPFTLTGAVTGTGSVTQEGSGSTLVLGTANGYTGGTTVGNGTLRLGNAQALGSSTGALTVNGGTVDLNGYAVTLGVLGGSGGTVLDNGSAVTLTIGSSGGSGTYSGTLANGTGTLSLNQVGGLEVLTGANTYTGLTTLTGGTLQVGNALALGPATNNLVINGGSLDLESFSVTVNTLNGGTGSVTSLLGSGALTVTNGGYFSGSINDGTNGTVALTQTGGTLILTGNNQYSGGTTLSAGTLQIGSGGPNGTFNSSGTVLAATISDNGALIFDTASATAVSNITGVLSGTGSLTQEGAGSTLILGGANTFSGGTTLTAGTIQIGNSSALDGSSGALVMNGGTLDLHGTALTLGSLNGTGGTILSNSANAAFTLGSGIFLGSLADGTNGTLALDAAGGTIILLGSNTYSGGTTVASGTLQVGNGGSAGSISGSAGITDNGTLIADRSGSITIGGAIGGSGNFTQAGTGTVTLGAGNSYGGTTTINGGGTVNLTTGSGTLNSSSKLTFAGGGGTFNFNNTGVSTTKSQQLGVLAFNGGEGEVLATYGSSGNVGTVTFSSLAARATGATGNFVTSGGTNGTNNTIKLTGQATGFINSGVFYDGGTANASYAFYDSTGYVRGITYGTDTGSLHSTGGALITSNDTGNAANTLSSSSNVEITGAVTAQTTVQIGTLQIAGAYNFTQASSSTLTVNGILKSGGNASTLSGGNLTAGSGDLVLRADQSGDVLTINDAITSATTGGITKSGAGQVVLNASNAYTGTTTVDAGTLTLGNAGALGSSSNDLAVNGGTLDLAGYSITVATLDGGGAGASVVSNGSAATLTVAGGGTFAGALANGTGTLSLVASSGTLTLTGANTYSGTTTVNGGTLQIGTPAGGGTLATGGAVSLANGTTLVFNSPGATSTLSGGVSGGGAVTQQGIGGTLILSGTNSYTGATTITAGTLQIGNGAAGGTLSSSTVTDNGALVFDTTSNLTYSGAISGTGTVTQEGAGSTLILNGADTYTGATLVAGGTLQLANGNTQSAVTVTGGTLDLHGNSTTFEVLDGTSGTILTNTAPATLTVSQGGTYGGALTDGTSGVLTLVQAGGTLALSGTNTYTGGTTIASGVLTVAGPGSLPGSVTIDTNSSLQLLAGGTYANPITVTGVGSDAANTEVITGALDFDSANATANLTGPITLGGATVFTNSAAGTETWNFTGGISGTGGLTFTAAGASGQVTFGLGGTNTFTGAIIVNQSGQGNVAPAQNATLQLLSAGAIPTGSLLNLNSSAGLVTSLDLNGYNATFSNLGGSTLGTSQVINTSATGATLTLANAGPETWGGTIGGTPYGSVTAANNLSLAVSGNTDLILTGVNTYTGTTTIGTGSTLQLGNGGANGNLGGGAVTDNGALIFNAASAISAPNNISGSGTLTQESSYGHTLTLGGADTYTGATTLAGGNITLAGDTGSLNGGAGTVLNFKSYNGSAGGTFTYDNTGASGAASQGMGALSFTAGEGAVVSILGGATSSTLTFSSLAARTAGATGDFITTGGANGSTNTIVLTGEATGFIDPGIFYDGGTAGASYAYYDAGNFVRGINYGVDSNTILSAGGTTIASGAIAATSNVETTGAITAQTTVQIGTLQISGANNFTQASGSILTLTGLLKSGGNAATLTGGSLTTGGSTGLVIRTDQAGDILTLSEPILASTTGGVTKSGAGTLLLLATNAYTGGTVVDAGTLQIGNGTTAGSITGTGFVTVEGGASLVVDLPTGGVLSNSISGGGGLTQEGTGTLVLTGSNSYSGPTTISSGTLQIGNGTSGSLSPSSQVIDNSALIVDSAAFSSNVSGTGTVSFLGSGTVAVTGAQTYTGTTVIDGGGTLNLYASIGSLNGTTGTPLTFTGAGGTFELNSQGEAGPKGQNMGTLTFAGGEGEVLSLYGSTGDVATLTFSSLAARGLGATGDFVTTGGANGSSNSIVLTGHATGFIDPGIFYDGGTSNASFAYDDAGGFVRGINYGVDTGSILSTGGANIGSNDTGNMSSTLSSSSNVEITGAITAQGSTQIATLQISGANNFTQSGGTLTVNGILKSGGNAATISGGSLASGSGDLVLRADQLLDTLTVQDSITSSGGLTKSGAGEVILSGGNSYTGTTTVDAGKLQLASSNALGSTANGLSVNGGTLDLNGNSLTASSLNGAGGTILGDGSVSLTVNGGGTYAGVIGNGTGSLALNQNAGTLVLTGANTFTGATTISGSGTTLQLGQGGTTGSLAAADNISVGNGDSLDYDNLGTTTSVSGNITGAGSLTQEGAGNTLILTGSDSYSGGTTISAGTIQVGLGTAAGSLNTASSVTDNGALVFDTTANTTFTGAITGTGSLTQEGANSTLILTQNDSYSGGTTIGAGSTLQVDNGGTTGALDPTANILDNGTLVFDSGSGAANPVLSGAITGTGKLTQEGGNTVILTGTESYSGATTISAGTLQVGNGGPTGSLPAAGNITDNGALVFNTTAATSTVTGTITGTGTLTQQGSGNTLVLVANNTYSGGTTIAANSTLQVGNGGNIGALAAAGNITDNGALVFNSNVTNNPYSGVISGSGTLTQDGPGILYLTGINTYSGGTLITGGTLQIGQGSTGSIVGNVTDNASLVFNNSSAVTFSGTFTGSGEITDDSDLALTLTGASAATFTGEYYVEGAPLIASGANVLGNTAAVVLGPATTLNISGASSSQTIGSLASSALTDSGATVLLGANTLTVGNGTNTVFTGAIQGTNGALVKQGNGTLALTGTNTYTGSTTISGGTLQIGNGGSTGTLPQTGPITDNANLAFDIASGATNLTASVTGTGSVTEEGSGNTLIVTGSEAYTGGTVIDAGSTVQVGSGGPAGSLAAAGSVTDNGALVFDTTTNGSYSGAIGGTGTLTEEGGNTLTLSGNNSYSGTTTVGRGTLLANSSTGSSTGTGNVNVSTGATLGGDGAIAPAAGNGITIAAGGALDPGIAAVGTVATGHITLENASTSAPILTLTAPTSSQAQLTFDLGSGAAPASSGGLTFAGSSTYLAIDNLNGDSPGEIVFHDNIAQIGDLTSGHLASGDYLLIEASSNSDYANLVTQNGLVTSGLTLQLTTGFQTQYTPQLMLTNGDLYLVVGAVPEPGEWTLLLAGLALVALHRRLTRRARS